MIHRLSFLALLASLAIPSGLRAQYRWHIIQPDLIDTFYFTNVSCMGENCSATGGTEGQIVIDSVLFYHSTDGGRTWLTVDSVPQQFFYPQGVTFLDFRKVQQIDSLDAIAVDLQVGMIVRTFDGWKTLRQDIMPPDTFNGEVIYKSLYDVDFSNTAEGMVDEGFGFFASTVDTGKHWKSLTYRSAASFHSYGNGMFRIFAPPSFPYPIALYTTHDNWVTVDTSSIILNGPFLDANVIPSSLIFGNDDMLVILGNRWDSTHTHLAVMMALSSDLGAHWSELPLPPNIDISFPSVTAIDQQTIVISGTDSVGRIVRSTDHGATWQADTVPLENGTPYFKIVSVAVTGSGRVIAVIEPDSNYLGSNMLAYLEPVPSSVKAAASSDDRLRIFPNPATNDLQILSGPAGTARLFDLLGQEVLEGKDDGSGVTMDISHLEPGVYFLRIGNQSAKVEIAH